VRFLLNQNTVLCCQNTLLQTTFSAILPTGLMHVFSFY